jgi:hypothetical protein
MIFNPIVGTAAQGFLLSRRNRAKCGVQAAPDLLSMPMPSGFPWHPIIFLVPCTANLQLLTLVSFA